MERTCSVWNFDSIDLAMLFALTCANERAVIQKTKSGVFNVLVAFAGE